MFAYTGYQKGHTLLSEAANDHQLLELARAAGREGGQALCQTYGFDPQDQRAFADSAIEKYQRIEIVDPIERNARDPIRKLGRYDRLVGTGPFSA
jgi:mannitol-1-phosphate 5-dehydrogenase